MGDNQFVLSDYLQALKVSRVKRAVHRVIFRYSNGAWSAGSGFFVTKKKFATCAHVALNLTLSAYNGDAALQQLPGESVRDKLRHLYNSRIQSIEIYINDQTVAAVLDDFSIEYDVALLNLATDYDPVIVPRIDWSYKGARGQRILFGGFPTHHSYPVERTPFAIHEGMISSITNTQIGGGSYDHLQIDSINLGGNSGAPVFNASGTCVIGMINGNHNWGSDFVLTQAPGSTVPNIGPFRVPLSIAYATPASTLSASGLQFS